jgi:glutamyl-tRNA reductase
MTSARAAERFITQWTLRFDNWQRERRAVPRIRQFRTQAEAMRAAEVERTLKALPELTGHHRAAIESLTRSLTQKLLHEPTVWLREHADTINPSADHVVSRDEEHVQ